MTLYPFTEICFYFQVKILVLGKFVGVGKRFALIALIAQGWRIEIIW
jgi:hypothetical protein